MTDEETYESRIKILKTQGKGIQAVVIRDIFFSLHPTDTVTIREAQGTSWERVVRGELSKSSLRNIRASLHDTYGLVERSGSQRAGKLQLTGLGKEFLKWLMNEGKHWGNPGVKDSKEVIKTHEKPLVYDQGVPSLKDLSPDLIIAAVPAGVDIYWGEVTPEGKKKPHKIARASELEVKKKEESVEEKRARLKAELKALGEGI